MPTGRWQQWTLVTVSQWQWVELRTTEEEPSSFKLRGRSIVSVVDICQRYVFPIPGSIFFSFSHRSLVIYDHSLFVRFYIFLLFLSKPPVYGLLPLPTAATYTLCHLSSISDGNLRCFFQCFSYHLWGMFRKNMILSSIRV